MSGRPELTSETSEYIKRVMKEFDVDEAKAGRIVAFCNTLCLEKFDKWLRNLEIRRRNKDESEVKGTQRICERTESED